MKQNGIRQVAFAALLLACILTACGLSGGKHVTNDYPEPSAEQSAMMWLGDILMSDSGRVMSGLQLARLSEDHSIRMVNLPVCDKDVLPHMGTYRHDATGGTIVFRPYTNEKDTVRPIVRPTSAWPYTAGKTRSMPTLLRRSASRIVAMASWPSIASCMVVAPTEESTVATQSIPTVILSIGVP